jgi:hypothetical protein
MMWRLRLMGRVWWLVILGCAVALLALAGGVYALTRDGGGGKAAPETTSPVTQPPSADVFYIRALAAETHARGCKMTIRFTWKPHYHALRYAGDVAVIAVTGPGISGTYRRPFSRQGVTLERTVSLAGGYKIWSARFVSVGGDQPGNETTIQAAPPQSTQCD